MGMLNLWKAVGKDKKAKNEEGVQKQTYVSNLWLV